MLIEASHFYVLPVVYAPFNSQACDFQNCLFSQSEMCWHLRGRVTNCQKLVGRRGKRKIQNTFTVTLKTHADTSSVTKAGHGHPIDVLSRASAGPWRFLFLFIPVSALLKHGSMFPVMVGLALLALFLHFFPSHKGSKIQASAFWNHSGCKSLKKFNSVLYVDFLILFPAKFHTFPILRKIFTFIKCNHFFRLNFISKSTDLKYNFYRCLLERTAEWTISGRSWRQQRSKTLAKNLHLSGILNFCDCIAFQKLLDFHPIARSFIVLLLQKFLKKLSLKDPDGTYL